MRSNYFMGGRSIKDNFKRRFGDPVRIEVKYEIGKGSPAENTSRSEKLSKACADVLRGLLGREPTQDEIIGKTDIVRHVKKLGKNEKDY